MRVMTLGGIGGPMPILSPSPQPYFIANESWSSQMPIGVRGLGEIVALEKSVLLTRVGIACGVAGAIGFYLGRRKRR